MAMTRQENAMPRPSRINWQQLHHVTSRGNNRCSIYEDKDAGRRLNTMLEMGLSRPWPDALQAMTGQKEMDATAIMDYFAPLKTWLDQQNAGKPVGW